MSSNASQSTLSPDNIARLRDPREFKNVFWPDVAFYSKQLEIIESVRANDCTVVHAAMGMGKDFVAGFIALWFFLAHHPVRIVTTSVKEDHLRILWGEILRFIDTAAVPLKVDKGGPLIVKEKELRKTVDGLVCKISYVRGMVSKKGEGMAGHHAPHTLFIGDEASGIDDATVDPVEGWAKKQLLFGNPNPCNNFFRRYCREGDLEEPDGSRYYRKVIHISAEHSPNVHRGQDQQARGYPPDNIEIVPGVVTYAQYQQRRRTWDKVKQHIRLFGYFWEGADNLLFPPTWLDAAERYAAQLQTAPVERKAKAIGIDPAEGGDETAMAAVDELGLIELVSKKTPDTSLIPIEALAFMRKHEVPPERVLFDRGGGGKQHADALRARGYQVQTVGFGDSLRLEPTDRAVTSSERKEASEDRYVYRNRRAQMYGELSTRLRPDEDGNSRFAIPAEYHELRSELAMMPRLLDNEGRTYMLPKHRKDANSNEKCLADLVGHSPDRSDALVLAVHALSMKAKQKFWME
jgi:hypothetical protein